MVNRPQALTQSERTKSTINYLTAQVAPEDAEEREYFESRKKRLGTQHAAWQERAQAEQEMVSMVSKQVEAFCAGKKNTLLDSGWTDPKQSTDLI